MTYFQYLSFFKNIVPILSLSSSITLVAILSKRMSSQMSFFSLFQQCQDLQIEFLKFTNNNKQLTQMSRPCAIIFIILCTLCCLGAIAVTVISYQSCLFMTPFDINCSPYLGYYKYCCDNCSIYRACTPYMYSAGAIVAQSILWVGFILFAALGHCMNRRHMRRTMRGYQAEIQMNNSGAPMVPYGTPVYGTPVYANQNGYGGY